MYQAALPLKGLINPDLGGKIMYHARCMEIKDTNYFYWTSSMELLSVTNIKLKLKCIVINDVVDHVCSIN